MEELPFTDTRVLFTMIVGISQRSAIIGLSGFPAFLQRCTAGFLLFCLLITSVFSPQYLTTGNQNIQVGDRSALTQVFCKSVLPITIVNAIFMQNCGAKNKEEPKPQSKNNAASLDYALCPSGDQVYCGRAALSGERAATSVFHAFAGPDVMPSLVKLKEVNAPPGSAISTSLRLLFLLLPRSDIGENASALSGERDRYAQLVNSSWVFLLVGEL